MSSTLSNTCTCTNQGCTNQFLIIEQELQFYKEKNLPMPTHCPACRHKQRMALRNERTMYKRICGKCTVSMLSVYPADAPYTVYCQDCFWKNIE